MGCVKRVQSYLVLSDQVSSGIRGKDLGRREAWGLGGQQIRVKNRCRVQSKEEGNSRFYPFRYNIQGSLRMMSSRPFSRDSRRSRKRR